MKEDGKPCNFWHPFNFNIKILLSAAMTMVFVITISHRVQQTISKDYVQEAVKGTNSTANDASLLDSCNLFSGKWIYDNESYPLYRDHECSFIDEGMACEKYGRKNLTYQHWRWQPNECNLPRFNATEMLEKLRNKRVVYVGDSLNKNQWYSMVCLIQSSIPSSPKDFRYNESLIVFKVLDYNVSFDFYWAPMLVESNGDNPQHHRESARVIRPMGIEKQGKHWSDADVLVFSSYIWWRQPKLKILWGSFESADGTYEDIDMLPAYEMVLKTWSQWLTNHVNPLKTSVFFVSSSPTHNRAEEWGKPEGQMCFYENEPITEEGYWGMDSDRNMMRLVEAAIDELKSKGFKAQMLNITQLSEYRKDAHPAMYRKFWDPLTKEQLTKPNEHTDCMHWCLPGVPDVWNQLLYAYLLYFDK